MSMDVESLAKRVAMLESKLAAKDGEKEPSEKEKLASEIEALERKLVGMAEPKVTLADVHPRTAADEEDDEADEKKAADDKKDEKVDDEKKASLVDPNGVEEKITQKRFTEVEDLEHGTELATGDSMLDVAPTDYVARLKNASVRLDAVADYLEKTGRKQLALRIDKVADAIDARVAAVEGK